jgi:hypothetical protein
MDPASAFGVVVAALQLAQFSASILNSTKEVYESANGISQEIETLETIHAKLSGLCSELNASDIERRRLSVGASNPITSTPFTPLVALTTACKKDCDKLLGVIDRIKSKGVPGPKAWASFRVALHSVLKRKELAGLQKRIESYERLIQLQFIASARYGHRCGRQ